MRSPLLPAFLLFLGLAGGCEELPERGVGICGNQVIDDAYEDCDGFSLKDSTAVCIQEGKPNACRLTCKPSNEGEPPLQCPTGWICGKDELCRRPSETLEPLVSPISADAQSLQLGDFDANNNLDVLAVGSAELTVFYFEPHGVLGSTFTLPNTAKAPAVGDLTNDGAADLTLPMTAGLGVLRGQKNRTLNPASYSSATAALDGIEKARFIAIDAVSKDTAFKDKDAAVGDEIMLMYSPTGAHQTVRVASGSRKPGEPLTFTPIFDLPSQDLDGQGKVKTALDLLRGELPVGDLNLGNQCEEFVVGFSGQSTIYIYAPCSPAGGWVTPDPQNPQAAPVSEVTLPIGQKLAGRVFLVDVNGDERLDLVFGSQTMEGCGVRVSYGLPDGTFHSDATSLPVMTGDRKTTELTGFMTKCDKPGSLALLAVGDINRDKCLDVVTTGEILLSNSGNCTDDLTRIPAGIGSFWTDARIADFNANGLLDVVAVAAGSHNVEFYNASPDGKLNPFTIPTSREVREIAVGDFDGDLVTDLAFNEGVQGSSERSLSIAFGRLAGAPESPISMGVYTSVSQLVAGDFRPFGKDAIADLLVASSDSSAPPKYWLSLLAGSSSRLVLAPLVITDPGETVLQMPLRAAVGNFVADADAHPDVAVLTIEANGEQSQDGSRVGLVMIPASGEAEFALKDQVSLSSSVASDPADASTIFELLFSGMKDDGFFSANLHATHLGSGPGDDLVLTTSPSGDPRTTGGALTILNVQADQWHIVYGETLDAGEYYPNGVRSADIDGDRDIDLAGILVNGGNAKGGGFKKRLDVFWNNIVDNAPSKFKRASLSLEDKVIEDFVFMDLDVVSGKEIVLATDQGIVLADLVFEKEEWHLKERKVLEGVPVGSLAAGDITGDGLDDLVIAQGNSVVFYRGKPVLE